MRFGAGARGEDVAVGTNGALVGYSCGIKTKELLLRLEGAIIL